MAEFGEQVRIEAAIGKSPMNETRQARVVKPLGEANEKLLSPDAGSEIAHPGYPALFVGNRPQSHIYRPATDQVVGLSAVTCRPDVGNFGLLQFVDLDAFFGTERV